MPYHLIKDKLVLVDVEAAANPLSIEYQIPELQSNEFDIIEL